MAFRVQYLLLADQIQELGGGKLNILGTFDRIVARKIPTRHASFHIVARITGETDDELGDHEAVFEIRRPNGQVALKLGGRLKLQPNNSGHFLTGVRLIVGVGNLPLRETGRHKIVLKVDGTEIAAYPVMVTEAQRASD